MTASVWESRSSRISALGYCTSKHFLFLFHGLDVLFVPVNIDLTTEFLFESVVFYSKRSLGQFFSLRNSTFQRSRLFKFAPMFCIQVIIFS